MNKENTIIITGASSGIGRALSMQYSCDGANLSLIARSEASLNELKEKCLNYGAKNVDIIVADVTDKKSMESIIANIANKYQVEIVFCSAGISAGSSDKNEDSDEQIINTNITGTLNTINPIIPIMKNQKNGQIALFSSLAIFTPMPKSAAYILTKSAIASYGECLNLLLDKYNISVSIIMPGFVNTKMAKASKYKDISMMQPEKAAFIIKEGISKRKNYIIFPKLSYIILKIFSLLPFCIRKYLINQFMR